jgi:hypothetical protein
VAHEPFAEDAVEISPVVASPVVASTGTEQRLREMLRDPGWSLPAWSDPRARVARVARRQRIRAASTAAIASAAAAAVIVTALSAFQAGRNVVPEAGATTAAYELPAVGAAGFPASIYPSPELSAMLAPAAKCPDPARLELRSPAVMRAQTLGVVESLGTSFRSGLVSSDRAYWPQLRADWRSGSRPAGGYDRVLYSGPLESSAAQLVTPGLGRAVRIDCGSRTASETWLIVTGTAGKPATQNDYLLLDRQGRLLVWDVR